MGWVNSTSWTGENSTPVGDRSDGWAFDGKRRDRLSGGSSNDYGVYTEANQVVGTILDIGLDGSIDIHYMCEGQPLGKAYTISGSTSMVPAFSANCCETSVVFNQESMKYWKQALAYFILLL
jgi:hypothetical protein